MLVFDELIVKNLMLVVHFEHLLVILLQHRVQHVREHILLNQSLLLLSGLLFFQRFKFISAFVFCALNEALPDVPLLIK